MTSPARKRTRFSDCFDTKFSSSENQSILSEPKKHKHSEHFKGTSSLGKGPLIVIDSDEDDFVTVTPKNVNKSSGRKRKTLTKSPAPANNDIKSLFMKVQSKLDTTKDDPISIEPDDDDSVVNETNNEKKINKILPKKSKDNDTDMDLYGQRHEDSSNVHESSPSTQSRRNTNTNRNIGTYDGKASSSVSSVGAQWNCEMCTFQNHKALNYCEICESPKQKKKSTSNIGRKNSKEESEGFGTDDVSNGPELRNDLYSKTNESVSETRDRDHVTTPVQSKYFDSFKNSDKESSIRKRKEVIIENTLVMKLNSGEKQTEAAGETNVLDHPEGYISYTQSSPSVKQNLEDTSVTPTASVKKYRFKSLNKQKQSSPVCSPVLPSSIVPRTVDQLSNGLMDHLNLEGADQERTECSQHNSSHTNIYCDSITESCVEELPVKVECDMDISFSSPELDLVDAAENIEHSGTICTTFI